MARSDINEVTLMGNIGNPPKLRFTSKGSAVTDFQIATNRSYKDSEGTTQTQTKWHRITVWGKRAEACAEHLKKGHGVYVKGHLEDNIWTDREGVRHHDDRIVAGYVKFLGSARQQPENNTSNEEPAPQPEANSDRVEQHVNL